MRKIIMICVLGSAGIAWQLGSYSGHRKACDANYPALQAQLVAYCHSERQMIDACGKRNSICPMPKCPELIKKLKDLHC